MACALACILHAICFFHTLRSTRWHYCSFVIFLVFIVFIEILIRIQQSVESIVSVPCIVHLDRVAFEDSATRWTRKLIIVLLHVTKQAPFMQHNLARRALLPRGAQLIRVDAHLRQTNDALLGDPFASRSQMRLQQRASPAEGGVEINSDKVVSAGSDGSSLHAEKKL